METDLLRTFATVAHTRSFTATARELGYVQSTVSGHLQTLEKLLGVRLLDRLSTGAVLTEAGARLLVYATQMLDLETRLADEVPAPEAEPTGQVRLIAPESLCAYRLPALLAKLRTASPGVRLTLAPGGTAHALQSVRTGQSEVALLLESTMAAKDLHLEAVGTEDLTLLAAPDFGLPQGAVTWAQLAEHDVFLLEDGCSYSDEVARKLLNVGQPDSRRIRFGSVEAVKRCVAAGLGWAVLPATTAMEEVQAGTLVVASGPLPPIPRVHLVTHPERTLSPAVHAALSHLRDLWAPLR